MTRRHRLFFLTLAIGGWIALSVVVVRAAETLDELIAADTKAEVLGTGYGFSEGPAADAQGNVYFSDGQNNTIHFYEVGQKVRPFVKDSLDANGQLFNAKGELYTCEGAAYQVVAFDVKTAKKRVLCKEIDGKHFNEPNDLAIDFDGGFYFTDPCYKHRGQDKVMKEDVYYCAADGRVTRVSQVCVQPNGIRLSADGKILYLADCAGKRVYTYEVLGPGKLAGEKKFADLDGHPDGMTLDEQGNLYVCCGPNGVKVLSPAGKLVGTIQVSYASNACFGGADFKTLYITAADKFLGLKMKVVGVKPLPLRLEKNIRNRVINAHGQ